MCDTEHKFKDTNRHLVEVPDSFAIARWQRDADVTTICRCILGTLKFEPHTADVTAQRRALESVIDHAQRASSTAAWVAHLVPTPTPPRFPADRDCHNSVAEREPK